MSVSASTFEGREGAESQCVELSPEVDGLLQQFAC